MFPHFYRLSQQARHCSPVRSQAILWSAQTLRSSQIPQNQYVLAQVDGMGAAVKDLDYTPTFVFYRKGRRVDQFYGSSAQQLRDHLWLQSEAPGEAALPAGSHGKTPLQTVHS